MYSSIFVSTHWIQAQAVLTVLLILLCTLFAIPLIFVTATVLQGFAVPKESQSKVAEFSFHGAPAKIKHGDVVIAAITSCTNTSNPNVMLGAALVAKKACELGLEVWF